MGFVVTRLICFMFIQTVWNIKNAELLTGFGSNLFAGNDIFLIFPQRVKMLMINSRLKDNITNGQLLSVQ